MGNIQNTFHGLIGHDNSYVPAFASLYYLDNYAGGDITWKAICEAWAYNDFEGRAWTIAIIDRMRQLLWDEPFDVTWAANPLGPKT